MRAQREHGDDAAAVHDAAPRHHRHVWPDGIDDLRHQGDRPDDGGRDRPVGPADTERAAMATRLPTLRDHGSGTAGDGADGFVDRRHERQQMRARRERRLGHRRRVVERRDHGDAGRERRLRERDRRSGGRTLRRLVGQSELAPERLEDLDDARALAGRGRWRRELHVDAERAVRRELARSRDVALEALDRHPRRPEDAQAARARHGRDELRRAGALGHAGEQDRQADAEQVAERRVQAGAHSSLEPAQRLMPLSVAWRSISASSSAGEAEAVERADIGLELRDAARSDERRGHARVTQRPRQGHLRQRLPAAPGEGVERADLLQRLLAQHVPRQGPVATGPRVGRDAAQVAVREHALRERREDDAADSLLAQDIPQAALDPAVEHRVRGLVDQQRRAQVAQDVRCLDGALRRVGRDAGIQRLALPYGGVQRAERLFHGRVRVAAVRVEDVDVVEAHALEALVEAREQVLAAAEVAVGAGPHVVAGLGRDHELVAEGREVLLQQGAERLLGGAVGRAVVVGEVEVRDAEIERAAHDRAARLERTVASEVLPQAERDRRQQQPAAPAAVVGHAVVAIAGGQVGHAQLPRRGDRPPDDTTSRAIGSKRRRMALRPAGAGERFSTLPGGAQASREALGAPPERVSSIAAQGR